MRLMRLMRLCDDAMADRALSRSLLLVVARERPLSRLEIVHVMYLRYIGTVIPTSSYLEITSRERWIGWWSLLSNRFDVSFPFSGL